MKVCWDGKCPKGKPICCVECLEKGTCGDYCETCLDELELEKYKRCPPNCPDRTVYNTDAEGDEQINCHMVCEGCLFRHRQNEEKKKQRAIEKEYDNFHKMTVWRMKEIMNNRKKGK